MPNGGPITTEQKVSPISIQSVLHEKQTEPIKGSEVVSVSAHTSVAVEQNAHFIHEKATIMGRAVTGAPVGDMGWYDDPNFGVVQRYEHCTIYWSQTTGAHEVHGAIRDKYDQLNGVDLLGLPTTDEQVIGEGRFNHFAKNGSIYWHPHTGPMAVHGKIRDLWAARGWEQSALRYPTRDVFTVGGQNVCLFQNGALSESSAEGDDHDHATVTADQLLDIFWHQFDHLVHESPDNVGLHPGKGLDHVSDTHEDFWASQNRILTLHVDGFHDNGSAPDTDFTAQFELLFYSDRTQRLPFKKEQGTAPIPGQGVFAALTGGHVSASGLYSGDLADGLKDAIGKAFTQPREITTEMIPADLPLIGLVVMADGSLTLWFVNDTYGRGASYKVQQEINNL